jgi:hypothetical protein
MLWSRKVKAEKACDEDEDTKSECRFDAHGGGGFFSRAPLDRGYIFASGSEDRKIRVLPAFFRVRWRVGFRFGGLLRGVSGSFVRFEYSFFMYCPSQRAKQA